MFNATVPLISGVHNRAHLEGVQPYCSLNFFKELVSSSSTPPPVHPMPTSDEDGETGHALTQLDDFLDLLSESTTDRIEQQRSSLPTSILHKRKPQQASPVSKFYLPTSLSQTSSRMLHPEISLSPLGWTATPTASMPNLSEHVVEEEEEEEEEGEESDVSPTSPSEDATPKRVGSERRAVSFDLTYDEIPGDGVEEHLKTRSAADMGETDEIVEGYWQTQAPPLPAAATSPPAASMYGNFLSPVDAYRPVVRPSPALRPPSPLAHTAYTSQGQVTTESAGHFSQRYIHTYR